MRQGCYKNTPCYSIIQELLKFLAKFGFSDLLGFWHDILLPQLLCGHMKGQNYMCHKKKKKKNMSCQSCFEFNFDHI